MRPSSLSTGVILTCAAVMAGMGGAVVQSAAPSPAVPGAPQAAFAGASLTATPDFEFSRPGHLIPRQWFGDEAAGSFERPPTSTTNFAAAARTASAVRDGLTANALPSQWNVVYTPDTNASTAQRAALQRAVDTWSQLIDSPVPITLQVTIAQPPDPSVLGAAGPQSLLADGEGGGGVVANTFYPVALANALTGVDLNGAEPEIVAAFSNEPDVFSFSSTPVPGQFDFETVVLHEIAHGLGFIGSMEVYERNGRLVGGWDVGGSAPRLPFIYDRHVVQTRPSFLGLFALGQDSTALAAALTTGTINWSGTQTRALYPCARFYPPLFSPEIPGVPGAGYIPGTSYSHLDEASYPAGSRDSLMTPLVDESEVLLQPGPVVLAMLRDMGWKTKGQAGQNALSACAAESVDLAGRAVVQGNAAPGTKVEIFFKLRTESAFVKRREAIADANGRWLATYTVVDDWILVAAANGQTIGPMVTKARPKIGAPPIVRVPRGTRVTFTGRGIPGTVVTLHQRFAGSGIPGFPIKTKVLAPANGVWRYTTVLDRDRLLYATGINGERSAIVTQVDVT